MTTKASLRLSLGTINFLILKEVFGYERRILNVEQEEYYNISYNYCNYLMSNESDHYSLHPSQYRGEARREHSNERRHNSSFRERGGYRGSRGHGRPSRYGGGYSRARDLSYPARDHYFSRDPRTRDGREHGSYDNHSKNHYNQTREGEYRETREYRDSKDSREYRDSRALKDGRGFRDSRDSRDGRESDIQIREHREINDRTESRYDSEETHLPRRNFTRDQRDSSSYNGRHLDNRPLPSREHSDSLGYRGSESARRRDMERPPDLKRGMRDAHKHTVNPSSGLDLPNAPQLDSVVGSNPWISILRIDRAKDIAQMEKNYLVECAINEKLAKLQAESLKLECTLKTFKLYGERDALTVELSSKNLEEITYM